MYSNTFGFKCIDSIVKLCTIRYTNSKLTVPVKLQNLRLMCMFGINDFGSDISIHNFSVYDAPFVIGK